MTCNQSTAATNQRYPLADYADWVYKYVNHPPPSYTHALMDEWNRVFDALLSLNSIFELLALITARWEFLGGLYRGNTGHTGSEDFLSFSHAFIEPIQPRYSAFHDITGRRSSGNNGSDLFSMFRNNPLHGITPTATAFPGGKGVIAWWSGVDGIKAEEHLTIDSMGKLHVSGRLYRDEFIASIKRYIQYLIKNAERNAELLPQEQWLRGFWAQFKPVNMDVNKWMKMGEDRGIPRL